MLSVRYGSDVPPAMAQLLEHHARHAGLSLAALESIGAALDQVEAFIVASEDGLGEQWAREQSLLPPTDKVGKARWVADRLFSS